VEKPILNFQQTANSIRREIDLQIWKGLKIYIWEVRYNMVNAEEATGD